MKVIVWPAVLSPSLCPAPHLSCVRGASQSMRVASVGVRPTNDITAIVVPTSGLLGTPGVFCCSSKP